jgi:hypothetical protein
LKTLERLYTHVFTPDKEISPGIRPGAVSYADNSA